MNKLVKGGALYFIKQIILMVLPLVTVTYVSRTLTVDNIGISNYSNSLMTYFILIAIFGINTYGLRELSKVKDSKEKSNNIISEMITLNLFTTISAYIFLFILVMSVPYFYELRKYILIASGQIFFYAFSWEWILASKEEYGIISLINVASYIFVTLLTLLFVKNDNDVYLYIFLTYLGNILNSIINFIFLKCKYQMHFKLKRFKMSRFKSIWVIFSNTVLQTIYVNIDTLMIGIMLNQYQVGLYSASVKIYTILKTVFSTPITVCISRCAYYFNSDKNKYNELINSIIGGLLVVVLPCIVGVIYYAKDILYLIYSDKYLMSASSLQILSIVFVISLTNILINSLILIPQNKENLLCKLSFVSSFFNVGLNYFIIPIFGINGASLTTLMSEFIILIFTFKYLIEIIDKKSIHAVLVDSLMGMVIVFITVIFVKIFFGTGIYCIFISVFFGSIIYLIILALRKNFYFIKIYSLLRKRIIKM